MLRKLLLVFAVTASALMSDVPSVSAQSPRGVTPRGPIKWVILDAAGYGGVGFIVGAAAGLAMSPSCPFGNCSGLLIGVLGGTAAGLAGGAAIGNHARQAIANGQPLSAGHRSAVLLGTVLGGATLGALSSALLINGNGAGTPLGTDEATFGMLTGGGTALGLAMAIMNSHELDSRRMSVRPSVGKGSYGLSAKLAF